MRLILFSILFIVTVSAGAQAADPTRIHKDDYLSFCISKKDSEAFCRCSLDIVDAEVAKRKGFMERDLHSAQVKIKKKYEGVIKLAIRKRIVKDEAEIQADCDIMRGHAEGEVSDAKFEETFSGHKAGFYVDRLKNRVCFADLASQSKTAELYEKKDYEYINASYVIGAAVECRRTHLK
ncbi:hypothetical protein [Sneathiella glossodoripedis]|uniref:hypothetical protein n=1 Tax=Sneathiella glossodoripedis TaxID=418853 RepID=UPI000470D3C3|nr:hypothetical protein [Sneathiella glossodoripedis]